MTDLLLVRHGRPESGHFDPPLADEGVEQATRLAEVLGREGLDVVLSSDLRRARETASLVAETAGVSHQVLPLPGLREWGLDADSMEYVALEVLGADAPQVRAVAEGRFMDFVPEQVDLGEFRRKVLAAFDAVLAQFPKGKVAVVCHGGVINAYVGHVLGIRDIFWFHPDYTSVSRLRTVPGRTVLESLNEAHHLAPLSY